jgi:hypothetical protein
MLPSQMDFQPPNSLQTVPKSTEATSTLATASVSGPVPPPSVVEGEGSKSKKKRAHTVCLPYFNPLLKLDTNSPSFCKLLTLPSFPKLVDPCFKFSLKLPEQIPEPTSVTLRSDVRYNGTQLTRSLKTHTSISGDAGHPALNSYFVQKAYKGMIFKQFFFRPFAITLSIYTLTKCSISGLSISVTSSWNMVTELVHPIGNLVSLIAPYGV